MTRVIVGLSFSFFNAGYNTLTSIYPGEVFPTEVRGIGTGFAAAVSRIGAGMGTFLLHRLCRCCALTMLAPKPRARAQAKPPRYCGKRYLRHEAVNLHSYLSVALADGGLHCERAEVGGSAKRIRQLTLALSASQF